MRALLAALVLLPLAAHAETLRVGNDAPTSIANCPVDYGMAHGQFAAHGLTLETSTWFGATKGQTAMVAGTLDVLLGSGTEMAFVAKGAPELAVAVSAGPPANIALVAAAHGPVHAVQDLAGRRLGITTAGGLTDWLARQLIRHEGFAKGAITVIDAGATATQSAMLATGDLDAAIMDTTAALTVANRGIGRLLLTFNQMVPDFVSSAIFAHRSLIDHDPAALRGFLAAFFEAQKAMLADQPGLLACLEKKNQAPPDIAAEAAARLIPALSRDGRFPPAALAVLGDSFVDLGLLQKKPDMHALYTEAFLPAP